MTHHSKLKAESDHLRLRRSTVQRILLILVCALLIGVLFAIVRPAPDVHAAAPQQLSGPVCGNAVCQ